MISKIFKKDPFFVELEVNRENHRDLDITIGFQDNKNLLRIKKLFSPYLYDKPENIFEAIVLGGIGELVRTFARDILDEVKDTLKF